ncbi:hypothetical protein BJ508DRAFT_4719 [Ascobolus immersus RN42]|uniref:Bromo domain-containing protein n=1 Tax=Ascobolus immersus RN42 TaxID=1160509 RepID=A0A3N4IQ15_ASCIM|nr:hypothetical protein BJ508DRAFT_4719 [Ascobolus immersus RN42]
MYLDNDHYGSLEEVVGDIKQMAANARLYNESESQIAIDATKLEQIAEEFLKSHPTVKAEHSEPKHLSPGPASISGDILARAQLTIVEEVRTLTDENDEPLSAMFDATPNKQDYPEYYEVIKEPISLNKIKSKIKKRLYSTWDAFERDIRLIRFNAETFNEEDSAIVKDARTLEGEFLRRIAEARVKYPTIDKPSGAKITLPPMRDDRPPPRIKLTARGRKSQIEESPEREESTAAPSPRYSRHVSSTPQLAVNGRSASIQSDSQAGTPVATRQSYRSGSALNPYRSPSARPSNEQVFNAPTPMMQHPTSGPQYSRTSISPSREKDVTLRMRTATPTHGTPILPSNAPTSQPQIRQSAPHPFVKPIIRFRPSGHSKCISTSPYSNWDMGTNNDSAVADGLVEQVTLTTADRSWSMTFPGHPTKLIQNFATVLSPFQHTLHIHHKFTTKARSRNPSSTVLHNGRAVHTIPAPAHLLAEGAKSVPQIMLVPGMNVVEFLVSSKGRVAGGQDDLQEKFIWSLYLLS